jgi:hypothetical protein
MEFYGVTSFSGVVWSGLEILGQGHFSAISVGLVGVFLTLDVLSEKKSKA